jgi:lipopolysaccharide cholinephosphotransferase
MKKLNRKEIKSYQISILKEIDSFCKVNNITYFLSGGTLLGAARHAGYIPWDDDLDLMMPRADYDRFTKEFESEHLTIYSLAIVANCRFPFMKVYDKRTLVAEDSFKDDMVYGVFVDIFPLDNAPAKQTKIKALVYKSIFYQKLLKIKLASKDDRWTLSQKVVLVVGKIILAFIPIVWFSAKIDKIARSSLKENSPNMGCMVWGYGLREILDMKEFAKTVYLDFESFKMPAPIGYKSYLSSLYGDYMTLPPIEKQKVKHNFDAFEV